MLFEYPCIKVPQLIPYVDPRNYVPANPTLNRHRNTRMPQVSGTVAGPRCQVDEPLPGGTRSSIQKVCYLTYMPKAIFNIPSISRLDQVTLWGTAPFVGELYEQLSSARRCHRLSYFRGYGLRLDGNLHVGFRWVPTCNEYRLCLHSCIFRQAQNTCRHAHNIKTHTHMCTHTQIYIYICVHVHVLPNTTSTLIITLLPPFLISAKLVQGMNICYYTLLLVWVLGMSIDYTTHEYAYMNMCVCASVIHIHVYMYRYTRSLM